jgi:hypothetical protein
MAAWPRGNGGGGGGCGEDASRVGRHPQRGEQHSGLTLAQVAEMLFVTHRGRAVQLQMDDDGEGDGAAAAGDGGGDGGRGGKTLFCFCLELLARGLVLLYGGGGSSVALDRLSAEDFGRAAAMLACAGIVATLTEVESGGAGPEATPYGVDTSEARAAPEGLPLARYRARVTVPWRRQEGEDSEGGGGRGVEDRRSYWLRFEVGR